MAYTRINWQDLPSTATPRNATNLNKMDFAIKEHDDKLLGNASMGNIVVDSIRSKNMFDKNAVVVNKCIPENSTSENLSDYTDTFTTEWIPCKPNTSYKISGTNVNKNRCQLKSSGGTITYLSAGSNYIINTSSDTAYFRIYFCGEVSNPNFNDVQIEKGTTATNYAPYISFEYKEPIEIAKAGTGTPTSFTLPEDISNYKYIDFVVARGTDYGQAVARVYYDTWYTPNVGHANMFYTDSNSNFYIESIKFSISGKNVTITPKVFNIFGHTIDTTNIAYILLAVYGYK